MRAALVNLAYLVAAVLFILTFKGLSHPRTAARANRMGAFGMLLAIVAALTDQGIVDFKIILAGMLVGGGLGAVLALRVRMTAMPQMVALLNGFGGAASVLVGGAAFVELLTLGHDPPARVVVATAASGLIGGLTFFGSLVAWAQLEEFVFRGRPVLFPGQKLVNGALLAACVALAVWLVFQPEALAIYAVLVALGAVLGVLSVMSIGGADMPVVICLLNSYSGLAAAATGFVLDNTVLIISGSLVGAAGIILTRVMCKAMNRSLANVLFGGVGAEVVGQAGADAVYAGKVKAVSSEEIAMVLDGVQRVVIVPGYGMAVSQAQHAVRDLAQLLEQRGVEVRFGVHPVAGRMPGHMNVLLADADIPYDKVLEMDAVNPLFEQTDVAIIIGANDVVNPAARTDAHSPIAGMPILDVDRSKTVIVIKRSLSPGFAGIPNPLFALDNTLMFFSDGRNAVLEIIGAVKQAA